MRERHDAFLAQLIITECVLQLHIQLQLILHTITINYDFIRFQLCAIVIVCTYACLYKNVYTCVHICVICNICNDR